MSDSQAPSSSGALVPTAVGPVAVAPVRAIESIATPDDKGLVLWNSTTVSIRDFLDFNKNFGEDEQISNVHSVLRWIVQSRDINDQVLFTFVEKILEEKELNFSDEQLKVLRDEFKPLVGDYNKIKTSKQVALRQWSSLRDLLAPRGERANKFLDTIGNSPIRGASFFADLRALFNTNGLSVRNAILLLNCVVIERHLA